MNLDARKWPLVEVVDPSMTRGLYVCWFQRDVRTDRWYVVWAAHIEDAAISVMVEQVKRERRFIGKEPELAIMDAKGGRFRIDKERDEDWFTRFRQLGLDYVPNDEPAPLEELDEWLRLTWDPVLEKMVSKLTITQRVADLPRGPLWALQRLQWNPLEMSAKQLLGQPGKDYVDCLKYFVNQRSINRGRLSRGRNGARKTQERQSRLAESYGLGKSGSYQPGSSRPRIWAPPSYR
jgi:hypothetical protein